MSPDPPRGTKPSLALTHGDPVAVELAAAIRGGELGALRRIVGERPEMATVRMIGGKGLEGGWSRRSRAATITREVVPGPIQ
jgi:hypothetical protein